MSSYGRYGGIELKKTPGLVVRNHRDEKMTFTIESGVNSYQDFQPMLFGFDRRLLGFLFGRRGAFRIRTVHGTDWHSISTKSSISLVAV